MSTKFSIIIPIRYASSRLPGKALLDVAGKTLVERVFDKAMLCGAEQVIIATDDNKIAAVAKTFGASVCMTRIDHATGTDRLSEVVQQYNFADDTIVVNLQGDEPLIAIDSVHTVVANLQQHKDASIATLATRIMIPSEVFDPNVVKVLFDNYGYALYFSRAPIPWDRDNFKFNDHNLDFNFSINSAKYYRHLGLYAYRSGTLQSFSALPESDLEQAEFLEQLRMLANGSKIHIGVVTDLLPKGVDTVADLERVRAVYAKDV
ncbi:MAG: 3-deoxy-manno-octulosonate cytidylyltransferase [Legionellales bacterium]|nr:MAG: 3-deoxy-manno-octulosonate cytidylyltransferase [Legionellales bacterium]